MLPLLLVSRRSLISSKSLPCPERTPSSEVPEFLSHIEGLASILHSADSKHLWAEVMRERLEVGNYRTHTLTYKLSNPYAYL